MVEVGGEQKSPPSSALIRKLVGGAAIGGSIKLVGVGLAFLFFLVLARVTTPEAYGIFAAAFSLATIVGFAATLGQHTAILRFWPSLDEKHGPQIASRAIAYGLGLTFMGGLTVLVIFAILALNPPHLEAFGQGGWIYFWTGMMAMAFALSEFSVASLRARGSLVGAMGPREIGWRLAVIGAVMLISLPLSGEGALAVAALALLAMTIPQLVYVASEIWRHRRATLPQSDHTAMRHAMWGLWGGGVVGPITQHSSIVVVSIVLGPSAAGAYFAADRLAKLLSIALMGVNQIAAPMLARSYHAARIREVRFIATASGMLALTVASLGFAAYLMFGRLALEMFDPSYGDSFTALVILAVGQLVNSACGPNNLLLSLAGRERLLLAIMLIWATIGVILVHAAATRLGITGAALAGSGVLIGWNISSLLACSWMLGSNSYLTKLVNLVKRSVH